MKIAVCGDSYMSPDVNYPGSHFSELLAKKLDAELVVYSKPGMSNGGIAMTLESALELRPNLLLIGTTLADRIEFPVKYDDDSRRLFTADDIAYKNPFRPVTREPKFVSTNLVELLSDNALESWSHNFDGVDNADEKLLAVRAWYKSIYHSGWKQQTDQYVMYAVLHHVYLSRIPYILCVDNLPVASRISWFDKDDIAFDLSQAITEIINPTFCGNLRSYHTTDKAQQDIAKTLFPLAKRILA